MNRVWDLAGQYPELLILVTVISVVGMVLGILAVSRLVVWLPSEYFLMMSSAGRPPKLLKKRIWFVKNLIGAGLLILGFVMLFVPGQGLLTLFLGLVFLDFPGKRKVILFLIRRKTIRTSLNWVRRKKGCRLFVFPDNKPR